MAKCPQPELHKHLWRIKKIVGNKRIIFCLVCEFEWESESKQYERLPMLTEEEKENHLVDMYD
jgi:hypothetical protein